MKFEGIRESNKFKKGKYSIAFYLSDDREENVSFRKFFEEILPKATEKAIYKHDKAHKNLSPSDNWDPYKKSKHTKIFESNKSTPWLFYKRDESGKQDRNSVPMRFFDLSSQYDETKFYVGDEIFGKDSWKNFENGIFIGVPCVRFYRLRNSKGLWPKFLLKSVVILEHDKNTSVNVQEKTAMQYMNIKGQEHFELLKKSVIGAIGNRATDQDDDDEQSSQSTQSTEQEEQDEDEQEYEQDEDDQEEDQQDQEEEEQVQEDEDQDDEDQQDQEQQDEEDEEEEHNDVEQNEEPKIIIKEKKKSGVVTPVKKNQRKKVISVRK
jgi:hypothetical protein